MKIKFLSIFLLFSFQSYCQSDFEKLLKGGELLLNGFSVFKIAKGEIKDGGVKENNEVIKMICVRNKLNEKITFKIISKDDKKDEIKRELVIQAEGKECIYDLPKGVYTYEVILFNKDIFQKGEYIFDEETTLNIKKE